MALSNDLAALLGFPCEAVLWGVNSTLFAVSLIILGHRRQRDSLNNPIIYLNCLIFACCTTHFALEFSHYFSALSTIGVSGYADETSDLLGADFLISFTDLLGDLVLIYRCWMLWGKNYYVVILPLLTSIAGFACIIGVLDLLLATNPTSPAPPAALVPLGLAGYVLPLCTNILVTSLIVYRIWVFSRPVSGAPAHITRGDSTLHAMSLIIESGALYLLFQLVFVILFAISNSAEAILAVMAVQIYGIAPTLIIIRVALGISTEKPSETVVSTRLQWVAHRVEDIGASATHYTDGFLTNTDMEGAKEANLSKYENHEHATELKLFDFTSSQRVEEIHSPV